MGTGHTVLKLFYTAALAAAIAGDDSSHDKGPVGLGRSRGAVLKYLKIDLTVERERERELETAVSMQVLAHVLKIIVHKQKIQRVENSQWEKIFDEKFSPLTSTGEVGENFLLSKFLSYTVHPGVTSFKDACMITDGLRSFLSGCLMQNKPLSLQLVCNHGNHSVVETTNLFL